MFTPPVEFHRLGESKTRSTEVVVVVNEHFTKTLGSTDE